MVVVNDIVEQSRFGALQLRVLILCALIAVVDGFDVTAMAVVAPRVAQDWGIAPGALGPALSASLVGLAVGGALGGPLGDRFGRRPVLLTMFLAGLIATMATATATTLEGLVAWRFLTGLGLGGTIPLGAALTAEYMPRRMRSFLVVLMFSGHPLGGALASLVAPTVIASWDWHYVFYAGGILPLAMCAALWWALPESPRFIALKGDRTALVALIQRIDPTFKPNPDTEIVVPQEERQGYSVRDVFGGRRAMVTVTLWAVFFGTQFNMFMLSSWLPTIFGQAGVPMAMALYASMTFNIGGAIGSIAFGAVSDRASPTLVLAVMYLAASLSAVVLATVTEAGPMLFAACLMCGIGGIGAQLCLNAFTAMLYPGHIRATGLGWALSIGRIGAMLGPLIAGWAMIAGWSSAALLHASAAVPILCALGILALRRQGSGERVSLATAGH